MGLILVSCNFLDVVPEGSATTEDIYKTQAQAEKMVIGCYSEIPNYFHPQNFPDVTGSDEMVMGHRATTRWFHYKSLMNGDESSSTTYYGLWSNTASSYPTGAVKKDIWNAVRYCYNVINNLDKVPDITEENKKTWKGEALFLIAYYHQIMLEYYGPIFMVKEEKASDMPSNLMRSPYDECVDFIADKYDESAKLLPAVRASGEKNRATSAAALGYKARLLLYAASPLVNGNAEFYTDFKNPDGKSLMNLNYDREKWKKAMDASEEAIKLSEANGYKLYGGDAANAERGRKNYHEAFVGGNSGAFNNWDEILFGLADQGTISYCIKNMAPRIGFSSYSSKGFRGYMFPTWSCATRYFTDKGLPWTDDPDTKNLKPEMLVSSPDYPAEKTSCFYLHREPRFYASIGFDRGKFEIQNGTIMLKCRRGETQQDDGVESHEYQCDNGLYCQKWISSKDSYNATQDKITYNSWVFPYLRLAELYLDYVEADFEYNKELSAKSLSYLNKIRSRCGLPSFQDSWSYVGGIPTDEAKLRNVIHDERSNELAMEGRRFHDIRRWKIMEKVLCRKEKSWNIAGKTAEDYYKLTEMNDGSYIDRSKIMAPKSYWLAIPIDQMQIDYNLVQNPGY
ncbi:Starch-binding associating with outer membrane [Prevotella sp. kh1p2]|nr:Starch-binding associating with outer membrane [Prevotella sp. kh1p2]SNU12525.1 Starch-binding associating with outer membrane [Prevotellaceae bacterium KH2P17]